MKLCRELHDENGLFPLNEAKLETYLERAFTRDGGFLGIIGPPKKVEGLVFLIVSNFWYSDASHLEELFLYVVPDCRRAKTALELMAFAKWCSEESGLPLIIGAISNIRTKGKIRLYQRAFSDPVGSFFLYKADSNKAA